MYSLLGLKSSKQALTLFTSMNSIGITLHCSDLRVQGWRNSGRYCFDIRMTHLTAPASVMVLGASWVESRRHDVKCMDGVA